MSASPEIHYGYCYFIPYHHNGKVYQFGAVTPDSCELVIDRDRTVNVNPREKFPIDRDIEVLNQYERGLKISLLLSLIVTIFLTYLIIKEDFGRSMLKTGGFTIFTGCSLFYFHSQSAKKCFEIANKVICTREGREELYAYSDYMVSYVSPDRQKVQAQR